MKESESGSKFICYLGENLKIEIFTKSKGKFGKNLTLLIVKLNLKNDLKKSNCASLSQLEI